MTKHLIVLSSVLVVLAASALAQQPAAPAANAEDGKKRVCQLRGWLFPGSKGDFTLRIASAVEPGGGKVLSASGAGSPTSEEAYIENPAGSFVAEVTDANSAVLASQQVRFDRDGYYTLLACQDKEGKWSVTSFSDSLASANSSEKPIRVLNFADGRETLVEFPGAKTFKVAGNSWAESKHPARVLGITVKVLDPDGGAPAQSSTETDLGVWPTAYVLVAPDHRGRMRPRLIDAGEPKYSETEAPLPSATGQQ